MKNVGCCSIGDCKNVIKRAVCMFAGILLLIAGSCRDSTLPKMEGQNEEPSVNLRAIILGNPPETGMDELYQQLDALTLPELNCTLRFEYIPWGDERRQLNTAILSGEYDLIPEGVFSDYRSLISKHAFLDLNQYLYLVPDLKEHYTSGAEDTLASCEINGGLYGIPQYSIGVKNSDEGFFYREDLRKKWGLEPVTDLNSMEAYLYRAKEDEAYRENPLITDNRIWTSLWLILTGGKYLEIASMQETPFVVALADDPNRIVNRMETPEMQEVIRYLCKWREAGILESNMLTLSGNEGERGKRLMVADKKPCETNIPFWKASSSFITALWEADPEWEFGFFPYEKDSRQWYAESLADASVICVSAKTRYPETAIRLLEKIHTDQRYYNLLCYGVEGIHYELVDGRLDFGNIPNYNRFGWTPVSDVMLSLDADPVNIKWYEDVEKPFIEWRLEISRKAQKDPLEGFSMETAGISQVLADMEQVRLQYFQPILCGYRKDYEQALREANEALEQAGFRQYLESLRMQVQEFIAEN